MSVLTARSARARALCRRPAKLCAAAAPLHSSPALFPILTGDLRLLGLFLCCYDGTRLACSCFDLGNSEGKIYSADSEAGSCLDYICCPDGMDELVHVVALVLVESNELVKHQLVELVVHIASGCLVLKVTADSVRKDFAAL